MNFPLSEKVKKPILLLLMALFLTPPAGCTLFKEWMAREHARPAATREEQFVNACVAKALNCEKEGDYVEALKQYEIALTVDPSNQEAVRGRDRAEAILRQSAEDHYRRGMELQKQGKYEQAGQQFLTALRLQPDDTAPLEAISSSKHPETERYVVHKVRQGESLSQLAATYYGDPRKFSAIARYNNLKDAASLQVGQEIKIPSLEGMSAMKGSAKAGVPEEIAAVTQRSVAESESRSDVTDQAITYRELGIELFKEKRYDEAFAEFSKVLRVQPDDSVALDYAYQSCFEMAMALYEKQEYLAARDQFRASLRYKKDCQKCHSYIKKSEDLYKEMHYKEGIRYYGKEQLTEAIREWELVRDMDPGYKRVEYYINKAKEMLRKLEELKQELNEESAGTEGS